MKLGQFDGTTFDVAIIGGGSAGCVLANRLSADGRRKVLLVEAGRDIPPGSESSAILDTYPGRAAFDPANHWPGLDVHIQPVSHNAPERPPLRSYAQARLMGGGSSINGQVANRGTPDDYDEWAALGARGWDWQGVLPYFKRLERDLDFGGPLHGQDGPIPIHRVAHAAWPRFSTALVEALAAAGFQDIADQNGRYEDGWFAQSLSNDGRGRVSAAMAYLDAATRSRPNLAILAETELVGLTGDATCMTGVEVARGGVRAWIVARRIVIAAGALHSPAILMRAGIGPAPALSQLGIVVRADRPGVGRNLQEHPGIAVAGYLEARGRLDGATRRHMHAALRYSSGYPDCPRSDMYFTAAAKSAWHPVGLRVGTLLAWINKIHSRGAVALRSADPRDRPAVSFNFLADPRDAARLVAAVRFMAGIAAHPALAALLTHLSPASYSGFAAALGRQSLRNWLLTAPTALALDLSGTVRRQVFRRLVGGGTTLADLIADDDALEAFVRARVFGQWHPCGTCRMGMAADRDAVVDPLDARVHGVDGLHVVDASVMPTVPRANLNIPTIMIAEKFAAALARAA
jgi:5-(hydroxymethyl)furfural/furfural oxidase